MYVHIYPIDSDTSLFIIFKHRQINVTYFLSPFFPPSDVFVSSNKKINQGVASTYGILKVPVIVHIIKRTPMFSLLFCALAFFISSVCVWVAIKRPSISFTLTSACLLILYGFLNYTTLSSFEWFGSEHRLLMSCFSECRLSAIEEETEKLNIVRRLLFGVPTFFSYSLLFFYWKPAHNQTRVSEKEVRCWKLIRSEQL